MKKNQATTGIPWRAIPGLQMAFAMTLAEKGLYHKGVVDQCGYTCENVHWIITDTINRVNAIPLVISISYCIKVVVDSMSILSQD